MEEASLQPSPTSNATNSSEHSKEQLPVKEVNGEKKTGNSRPVPTPQSSPLKEKAKSAEQEASSQTPNTKVNPFPLFTSSTRPSRPSVKNDTLLASRVTSRSESGSIKRSAPKTADAQDKQRPKKN